MNDLLTDDELARLVDERTDDEQRWLAFGAVQEIALARRLVRGLYRHIPHVKGLEELQAELERYAGELGVE